VRVNRREDVGVLPPFSDQSGLYVVAWFPARRDALQYDDPVGVRVGHTIENEGIRGRENDSARSQRRGKQSNDQNGAPPACHDAAPGHAHDHFFSHLC
jgi:hypothetical protein